MASEQASQGDRWVQDPTLWAACNEDPMAYVLALRAQGKLSPPHDRPTVLTIPHAPAELPPAYRSLP